MIAITSLLIVLFLSLVIVRIASEALILTGMSRQTASFQARSAWSGTGFTTSESEQVVGHPVRRRIISMLMILRSAGLITSASTLMLSFVTVDERTDGLLRLTVLIAGLVALWYVARSQWISVWMSKLIMRMLKRYTDLDVRDFAGLLHLAGEYAVMELEIRKGSWMAASCLIDLNLPPGVLVLGVVHADGRYDGAPGGHLVVDAGDTLVLYGRSSVLAAIGKQQTAPKPLRPDQVPDAPPESDEKAR